METAQEGAARAHGDGPEPGAGPAGPELAPRRRRVGILLAVAGAVYALDIVSKLLVVAHLSYGRPVHVLGDFLQLTYTRNSGAAFSIGYGYTAVFSLIAVGVIFVILRLARRLYSVPWALALGLLLGGAIGNLTDRIVRSPGPFRGWVVDFVQFPHFAIFNLADAAITCGGVLMVLLAFRGLHPDGTDERAQYEADRLKEQEEAAGARPAAKTGNDGADGAEDGRAEARGGRDDRAAGASGHGDDHDDSDDRDGSDDRDDSGDGGRDAAAAAAQQAEKASHDHR